MRRQSNFGSCRVVFNLKNWTRSLEQKRNRVATFIFLATITVIATAWGVSATKRAEQKRLEQLAAEEARIERQKEAARIAREQAHESLLAMTRSDFQAAGQNCVDAISEKFDDGKSYGWDFVDLDPSKFGTIKNATLMGLRATAFGSEVSGHSLVAAQIDRTMASIGDYSSDVVMSFVISERMDSFGRLKEVLQLHKCSFNSTNRVTVFESDRFTLN